MAFVAGTSGNDYIHVAGDGNVPPAGYTENSGATDGDDLITSGGGGNDIIHAGSGNDYISFQGDLNGNDQIDGGDGLDTLEIQGWYARLPNYPYFDYSLNVQPGMWTGIEKLQLSPGTTVSYHVVIKAGAVPDEFQIDGSQLTSSQPATIDASQFNLSLYITDGADSDTIWTGIGGYTDLSTGGNDT